MSMLTMLKDQTRLDKSGGLCVDTIELIEVCKESIKCFICFSCIQTGTTL